MSGQWPAYGNATGTAPSADARARMRFDAGRRSLVIAYLLWFFLGYFGVHRFYLGRVGSGIVMLLISLVSIPLAWILIGYLGFGLIFLWWLLDALLIPGMVTRYNARLAQSVSG